MVEQVNTLWYIPTVEHYTAKKMNERASTVWVDFRNAESSNRSQTQKKDILRDFACKNSKTDDTVCALENKTVVTVEGMVTGSGVEGHFRGVSKDLPHD